MNNNLLLSLLIAVLMASCAPDRTAGDESRYFHLGRVEEKSANLSDLIDSVQLIPLETNDSCLLTDRVKYVSAGGRIYAASERAVAVFDAEGRFLKQLCRMGNGPEDYARIIDFDVVRRERTELWVLHPRGFVVYDAETLAYVRRVPLATTAQRFKYLDDRTVVLSRRGNIRFTRAMCRGGYVHIS